MKQPSFSSSPPSSQEWAYRKMGPQRFRRQRFLDWWYGIAAPEEAGADASDKQRDAVQRGRTASLILLCLIPIMFGVGYIGLVGPNKQILWTALLEVAMIIISIFMNRFGRWRGVYWGVNATGILLSLFTAGGMYLSILRAPGGLSVNDKDIFYLLMFSELMIGAILPARWIFPAIIINLVFSGYMLTFGPHTPALQALLVTNLTTILIRLFQVHVIPSVIVWSLALTTRESMDRANYAQHLARFERDMAQQQQQVAEQAAELQKQIEIVSQTLIKASQGDLTARVPLEVGSTLWQLATPMNKLFSQVERGRKAEAKLRALEPDLEKWRMQEHHWNRLLKEVESTLQVVQMADQTGKPLRFIPGKTPLDEVQRVLDGKVLMHSSHFLHSSQNHQ